LTSRCSKKEKNGSANNALFSEDIELSAWVLRSKMADWDSKSAETSLVLLDDYSPSPGLEKISQSTTKCIKIFGIKAS